jgi:ABC-2 type transport system permease protein
MARITKRIRLMSKIATIEFQRFFMYRVDNLIWIVRGVIEPLVLMVLWERVSMASGTLPLSLVQLRTYFIMQILVTRITQVWTHEDVGRDIKEGTLSKVLLQPYSYLWYNLGRQFGMKLMRLLYTVPITIILMILLSTHLDVTIPRITLFTMSLIAGFIIQFAMAWLIGLVSFWAENNHGFVNLYFTFVSVFSGAIVPLALMPRLLADITRVLPARYILSFPLEIITGTAGYADMASGFAILSIWTTGLLILGNMVWAKGLQKYQAVGI